MYIAQSGNLWLGGGTLYLYALGMGLPLMLITVFGNRLLPKSGPWMSHVKTAFGFVILALPVFLLERILGDQWGVRLWSMLGVAFFSWAFITSLGATRPWMRLVQIILLAAALVSARPLQDWAFGAPAVEQQAHLPELLAGEIPGTINHDAERHRLSVRVADRAREGHDQLVLALPQQVGDVVRDRRQRVAAVENRPGSGSMRAHSKEKR